MEFLGNAKNVPLFIFAIIILAYLWYTFSIVYHFIRFGVGRKPKILALVYFMGSFFLVGITLLLYKQVDWSNIISSIKV